MHMRQLRQRQKQLLNAQDGPGPTESCQKPDMPSPAIKGEGKCGKKRTAVCMIELSRRNKL